MRDDARELTRTWTTSSGCIPWVRWFLSVMCVTHIFMRHTSKCLLFLCWGYFLVNTFSHTLCLGILFPCKLGLNGKIKLCESFAIVDYTRTVRYDLHRRLIYLRLSAPYAEWISVIVQKTSSDGKIPTLKNGALNRGRASTLYAYVEPRNVTDF
jgi:hypothetical protein